MATQGNSPSGGGERANQTNQYYPQTQNSTGISLGAYDAVVEQYQAIHASGVPDHGELWQQIKAEYGRLPVEEQSFRLVQQQELSMDRGLVEQRPPAALPSPSPNSDGTRLTPAQLEKLARANHAMKCIDIGDGITRVLDELLSSDQREAYLNAVRRVELGEDERRALGVESVTKRLRVEDQGRRQFEAQKHAADLDRLAARSHRLDEFLALDFPGPTYAVDALLPHKGNAILQAPKKAGKTTTRDNLVRAFVDGEPFLGTYRVEPGVVGVWDYEMEDQQQHDWFRDAGIHNTEGMHLLMLKGEGFSLASEESRDWAVQWLRDRGVQVWVLDPAHVAMRGFRSRGGDPNDAVIEFTEAVDEVKQRAGVRNVSVYIHTGLTGDHARSAARWQDWPDAIWTLKRQEDGTRTLGAEGRDVELGDTPLLYDRVTRHLSMDSFASPARTYKPSHVDNICAWLRNHPDEHPSKLRVVTALRDNGYAIRNEDAKVAFELGEAEGRFEIRPGPHRSHRLHLTESSPLNQFSQNRGRTAGRTEEDTTDQVTGFPASPGELGELDP